MKHKTLCLLAGRWLRSEAGCSAVLVDCKKGGPERPDAIGWQKDGTSILIEAKRTRKDFLAEWTRKDRKAFRRIAGLGDLRYYLAPVGVIKPDDLEATGWGLIEAWPGRRTKLVVKVSSAFHERDIMGELTLSLAHLGDEIERLGRDIKQLELAL